MQERTATIQRFTFSVTRLHYWPHTWAQTIQTVYKKSHRTNEKAVEKTDEASPIRGTYLYNLADSN